MDVRTAVLLRHQQGLATRRQLLESGLSARALRSEIDQGRLARIGRGLYRSGPAPVRAAHLLSGGVPDAGYAALVRAELLRLGDDARAARLCAAVLWGMDLQVEPTWVDLDVAHGRRCERRDGVRVQESRQSRTVLWVPVPGAAALRMTTPVDTVLDGADLLPLAQAVVLADSALRRRLLTVEQLRAGVRARSGVAGLAHLRQVLRWCDARSGSVLESLLRVLLCEAGLVPPRTQHVVRDEATGAVHRVDVAWPEQRLVVECDGRRWHDPADRRDADRRRDNTCARTGWRVLRFTWAEVVHEPDAVVLAVRAALTA